MKRKSMTTTSKAIERAVMVTTKHKGVFFGYATNTDGDVIKLRACRMCVYWSSDMHGVLGLATIGPSAQCRITPPVDFEVREITGVAEVTPEAVKKWEASPWG